MRSNLSIKGKIKGFAHRWQQALLVNAEACEACGLCITQGLPPRMPSRSRVPDKKRILARIPIVS
jgi:hypothetical protein